MFTQQIIPNAPVKKSWVRPELTLISRNPTIEAKSVPFVRESSGHYTPGHFYFTNAKNSGYVSQKTQAIS